MNTIELTPTQIKAMMACVNVGADGYPKGWEMEIDIKWVWENLVMNEDNIKSITITIS